MTPKEQEIAIKELEERVDRVRNLYEQYFLGFERLEPTVPRKDLDRRLMLLRKEQIRNTAMRFRLNVIVQKYNTYAMHWVRICRQIEEGTYKRHVRRARARFGDVAAGPERDLSIDIDIGDFDMDMDVDEALAEANAAAKGFERPLDTVPPPPTSERTAPAPSPSSTDRAARPAALPPGAKPRVVLRKREEADLPPTLGRAPAPAPSSSHFVTGDPSSSAHFVTGGARPSGPRIAPIAPSSAADVASNAAPSGRLSASRPTPGAAMPASTPGLRIPASAPSVGDPPAAPPVARSAPKGPGPQIRPRVPAPPPSSPRLPAAPSSPKLPAAPPRPPIPSFVERDTDPGAPHARPPGTRPRHPLPVPSQSTRPGPVKKE